MTKLGESSNSDFNNLISSSEPTVESPMVMPQADQSNPHIFTSGKGTIEYQKYFLLFSGAATSVCNCTLGDNFETIGIINIFLTILTFQK